MSQNYNIRGRKISVNDARSIVHFVSGARGKKEAGDYAFWTAYGEDRYGDWKTTGRARVELPPTDRFTRMAREMRTVKSASDRRIYAALYRRLRSIRGLRAATYREVCAWMTSHKTDAKHVRGVARICGRQYRRFVDVV